MTVNGKCVHIHPRMLLCRLARATHLPYRPSLRPLLRFCRAHPSLRRHLSTLGTPPLILLFQPLLGLVSFQGLIPCLALLPHPRRVWKYRGRFLPLMPLPSGLPPWILVLLLFLVPLPGQRARLHPRFPFWYLSQRSLRHWSQLLQMNMWLCLPVVGTPDMIQCFLLLCALSLSLLGPMLRRVPALLMQLLLTHHHQCTMHLRSTHMAVVMRGLLPKLRNMHYPCTPSSEFSQCQVWNPSPNFQTCLLHMLPSLVWPPLLIQGTMLFVLAGGHAGLIRQDAPLISLIHEGPYLEHKGIG